MFLLLAIPPCLKSIFDRLISSSTNNTWKSLRFQKLAAGFDEDESEDENGDENDDLSFLYKLLALRDDDDLDLAAVTSSIWSPVSTAAAATASAADAAGEGGRRWIDCLLPTTY